MDQVRTQGWLMSPGPLHATEVDYESGLCFVMPRQWQPSVVVEHNASLTLVRYSLGHPMNESFKRVSVPKAHKMQIIYILFPW